MQLTDYVTGFLVGVLRYRTGVDDEEVRTLVPGNRFVTGIDKAAFVCGCLGVIQLAAERYV